MTLLLPWPHFTKARETKIMLSLCSVLTFSHSHIVQLCEHHTSTFSPNVQTLQFILDKEYTGVLCEGHPCPSRCCFVERCPILTSRERRGHSFLSSKGKDLPFPLLVPMDYRMITSSCKFQSVCYTVGLKDNRKQVVFLDHLQ